MPIALVHPEEAGFVARLNRNGPLGGRKLASGIWTSVSGASAQMHAVETVANNLANANTDGFKKDLPTFKEYLASVEREHQAPDVPRGAIKDKDFYPLDGRDQAFVVVDGTYTDFKQGNLRVTNSPLDVALDGPGMLEVSTPLGPRFTRAGSLKVAADGRLVSNEGHPVLSASPMGLAGTGPEASATDAARYINLRERNGTVSISTAGDIYVGENRIGQLNVVEFVDRNKVKKWGGGLFENKDVANLKPATQTVVRQGVIETSNVNPIEEMTNLIRANRMFEQDLKAMKTYGDMMQKEATDIGKL